MNARLLVFSLGLAILIALLGGVFRLGGLPFSPPMPFVQHHGALLGGVLFPGLIGLERAVALGRWWGWASPLMALLSLAATAMAGTAAYPLLMLLAGLLLLQQSILWQRAPGAQTAIPLLAAGLLLLTDWRWAHGVSAEFCAPGWASFLVLIIAAERIEFSFLGSKRNRLMILWVLTACLGVCLQEWRVLGAGWIGLAYWLVRHDIARLNYRRQGLAAYTACSVLAGYGWLLASGLQLLAWGLPYSAGPHFDRVLHGVFVGFVLSMVIAHGPIIFPAICKLPIRFSRWFYVPLTLLHLSLAVRCLGWQAAGGQGNLLAMLLFAGMMATHYRPGHNPWLAHQASSPEAPRSKLQSKT